MDFQLELISLAGVDWEDKVASVDTLPPNDKLLSKPVTREFLQELRDRGQVMEPILVAITEDGTQFVIAGNRRIKGSRILEWETIPARYAHMPMMKAIMARSADNNSRSSNDLADMHAIRTMMDTYGPTIADNGFISRWTSIPQPRIRKLKEYMKLPNEIIEGVTAGVVQPEAARNLAKLSSHYQDKAVAKLQTVLQSENKPRGYALTNDDVEALQRERKEESSKLLPMFPSFEEPKVIGYMLWDTSTNQPASGLADSPEALEQAANFGAIDIIGVQITTL
jgi:ParB-like chromosome segregation protein Spo0J